MRRKQIFARCLLMALPLAVAAPVFAQNSVTVTVHQQASRKIVKGVVTDSEGHSLPGVSIYIKGTPRGVTTDVDGNFSITVPSSRDVVLLFSYVGMKPKEVKILKDKKEENLRVRLQEDAQQMNEVVVTGMANLRKESFTGNTTQIRRDELMQVNKTNVIQALQAFDPSFRIAENLTMGSDPNALPEVSIRGNSGLGAGELDIDVTNKASLKNNPNLPTFIMDGFEISVTKLYDMDPSRIESITILKDAAATAMYGSRAANGVVVITTVTPKPGKLNVAYSFTGEVEMPDLTDYDLLNAREKLELERRAGCFDVNSGHSINQTQLFNEYNAKLYNVQRGIDTYWLSQPLQTAFNQVHSLYVDGGSEKLRFGVEVNINRNDGVMKGSMRNLWGVGAYIDYRIGNLQVRNHTTYTVNRSQDSPYGSFSDYTVKNPYDPYKDDEGNMLEHTTDWHGSQTSTLLNPLYEGSRLKSYSKQAYEELVNNLSVQWNIAEHWLFKSTLGLTRETTSNKNFIDPHSMRNSEPLSTTNLSSGELTVGAGNSFTMDWQASLSYNHFVKNHNINVMLNFNVQESKSDNSSSFYKGFPSGSLSSPNYAQEIVNKPSYSDDHARLVGTTLLANYSYRDIYLFDISGRLDGSSKFGSEKRFAPFWSTGVGLNLHNYEFMQNLGFVDLLRLRASYGQLGKVGFSAYEARTTYNIITDEWYKTGYGAVLYALGNKNLTWETTNTLDFGFEMSFFKNLFYLKASYYIKKTVDLINNVTIPSHTGFNTYKDNVGEIENKGFELNLRSNIIQTKDWYVSLFGNLAHNRNRVLKVAESLKDYNKRVDDFLNDVHQNRGTSGSKSYKKYQEGVSQSAIWAVKSLGIDPATGQEIFVTPDGKITNAWNSANQVVCGDTEPDAQGSFGFNVRWKNFSLYATFMYEWGGQRYNQTLADKIEGVDIYESNADRRVLTDRWFQPGDVTSYKKIDFGGDVLTTKATSRFVQDYNWVSLNSITLGYDFDTKISKSMGLSMLRLECGANELFRISSVKQERGLSYPYSRTLNFSLKASF